MYSDTHHNTHSTFAFSRSFRIFGHGECPSMLQLLAALCTLQLYKVWHGMFWGLPTAEECI